MSSIFFGLLGPLGAFVGTVVKLVVIFALIVFLGFFCSFFLLYDLNPFKVTPDRLRALKIKWKYHDLFRWIWIDFLERKLHAGEFNEYGFTFYVGRQGTGKTISMVEYLDRMKQCYPNCKIVTNFKYKYADYHMVDWHDILEVRNGIDGIIFAIDEIHSEYSASSWKDVPETLLSEVSQQRKQRVKIVATAQFFSRIAKPLREQAATIVMCSTSLKRLTKGIEYDALQYATVTDNMVTVRRKLKPVSKRTFVQSDTLRNEYDTYEKIERMKRLEFIDRDKRKDT